MLVKELLNITSKVGRRNFHVNNDCVLGKNSRIITSGIIVTGDEILRGHVKDTSSHFLCRKLFEMGIKVVKISKLPDDVEKISEEVKKFSKRYDYVLTTGGIGPTHDDITFEAVAKAFDDTLILHPELSKLVYDFYKITDHNHPAFKMAQIPSKAKLVHGYHPITNQKTVFPSVSVDNVFMFPGVTHFCELIFESTKTQLFSLFCKFYNENMYLTCSEAEIVDSLNSAVEKHPNVMFGSYPKFFDIYYKVKLSLEATSEYELKKAFNYLSTNISIKYQIDFDENPFEDKRIKFRKFNYGVYKGTVKFLNNLLKFRLPKNIFLYFDGGKNSTALLHLLSIVYGSDDSINCIYVELNPEINSYVFNTRKNYNINMLKIDEDNFKDFAGCNQKVALLKGTRRSDPNAKEILAYFEHFNMINPMADWSYADVWTFIRGLCLPYCELYDAGYTSITNRNAARNPYLIKTDPNSKTDVYKKAFELSDESFENASFDVNT